MKYIYAPGCALMMYKKGLAEKLKKLIEQQYGPMETLLTCCFREPKIEPNTCVITPCVTCHDRYKRLYVDDCTTIFYLNVLAESKTFPFPDYGGATMTIQDTCAARTDDMYLDTIRKILQRMNITVIEPERTRRKGVCCGQVYYGKLPVEEAKKRIKMRAEEMPCDDVVVYCATCIHSMSMGGKKPRYILDLLFEEETNVENNNVGLWKEKLEKFRNEH